MESIDASGRSIEDAILQALVRLGRRRDEVEVMVLQEPVRGSRGMAAREARVRVSLKVARPRTAVVTPEMADALLSDEAVEADELGGGEVSVAQDGEFVEGDEEGEYAAEGQDGYAEDYYDEESYDESGAVGASGAPLVPLREILDEDVTVEQVAVEALRAVLAHMGMGATLIEVREREPLTLNVRSSGDENLSILIGRRGDTLASLQLIVSLIVAKQTGQRERVIVDAESYRERREENLRSLAQRVAQQVRRLGAPVALEAMPPNERRIIHMELSEEEDLTTESSGEGDQRRIVIALRQP